jgi:type II secretory pathway component PulF
MLKEYQCTYIEPSGIEKKVIILARDTKEAIQRLKEQGFIITEIKEKTKKEISFTLRKGITQQDLYNIANQLSILVRSGMKIDEALNLLVSTSKKQKLKEVLTTVNQEIKAGQSIAKAIEKRKIKANKKYYFL